MRTNIKQNIVKLAKGGNEPAEFALGRKGVLVCPECGSYYFKKGWHNNVADFFRKEENRGRGVKKALCPACLMIKHGLWEGKVIIQNIPAKYLQELKNLIRNFSKAAQAEDTLDRLIKVEADGNALIITTTENQMAQKLAKHVRDAFNKVSLKISYQKAPGDAEIVWVKFD